MFERSKKCDCGKGEPVHVCVRAGIRKATKNESTVEIKITKELKLIRERFCSVGVHVQGQLGVGWLICSDTWPW